MQLNQLYGYFGRNQDLIITKNVNKQELDKILLTRIVENVIEINNDNYLVLLKGNLHYSLIQQLNLKLDLSDYKQISKSVKSNVAIAAAVTSYAQMVMMKYKTLPGYTIYYSDTDSIFINKPLPDHLVDSNELGFMKNELYKLKTNKIDVGIFLGNKKYGLLYTNDVNETKFLSVFSGASKGALTFDEMMAMSRGEVVPKEFEDVFYRDFKKMEITIKPRKLDLTMSKSKKLVYNQYKTPHIYNGLNIFDFSHPISKIFNKFKLLIKHFTPKL